MYKLAGIVSDRTFKDAAARRIFKRLFGGTKKTQLFHARMNFFLVAVLKQKRCLKHDIVFVLQPTVTIAEIKLCIFISPDFAGTSQNRHRFGNIFDFTVICPGIHENCATDGSRNSGCKFKTGQSCLIRSLRCIDQSSSGHCNHFVPVDSDGIHLRQNHDDAGDAAVLDDQIACIADNGQIKAVSAGTATITAASHKNPEVHASCTVQVLAPNYTFRGLLTADNQVQTFEWNLADSETWEKVAAVDGIGSRVTSAGASSANGIYAFDVNGSAYEIDFATGKILNTGSAPFSDEIGPVAYDDIALSRKYTGTESLHGDLLTGVYSMNIIPMQDPMNGSASSYISVYDLFGYVVEENEDESAQ